MLASFPYNQNIKIQQHAGAGAYHEKTKKTVTRSFAAGREQATILSVDERVQMVLSKELREKAGINAGDELAVASGGKNGEVCCITLLEAESLVEMVKGQFRPVMKELF